MNYNDFSQGISGAGLSRGQVIVVGSSQDLLHWPTGAGFLRNPLGAAVTDYGYNPNSGYNYVVLERDLTAIANRTDPILGHGSMFQGILSGHLYDLIVNNISLAGRSLSEILKRLIRNRVLSIGSSNDY